MKDFQQTTLKDMPHHQEDINHTKALLLQLLTETKARCEHISVNIENQERNVNFAFIPKVVKDRANAQKSSDKIKEKIEDHHKNNSFTLFFDSITEEKGLFYQIFRGKCNKNKPNFSQEIQSSIKFSY